MNVFQCSYNFAMFMSQEPHLPFYKRTLIQNKVYLFISRIKFEKTL